MGMSPSCHCICPGEAGPGSPSPAPDTVTSCTACNPAARRYIVTVAHPTTDPSYACCCGSYTGGFYVIHNAGTCTWSSVELSQCCKRDSGGNSCSTIPAIARFALIITSASPNIRYEVVMNYGTKNLPSSQQEHQVRWRGTAANCLTSATIAYLSHVANLSASDCGGDLSYGGPCVNGINIPSAYAGTTCFVQPVL